MAIDFHRHRRRALLRKVWSISYPIVLGGALGVCLFLAVDRSAALANDEPQPTFHARPQAQEPTREALASDAPLPMIHARPQAREPSGGAFRTCDAARAAGAGPVYRGQNGYGPHLDRDNDGVGCEPYPR